MKKSSSLTKRALSVFLCMVMLLMVMFSVPFSVNAETTEIQAETQAEVVENNDENISSDTTEANKERTTDITKKQKTDISDVGSDALSEFEVDGIKYAEIDDVSVKAIGYNKELLPENLVIPETVEGKTVTKVGVKAFYKAEIKSVILPQTVTSIGKSAFSDCTLLEIATILGNVTTIENDTFAYCSNLKEVYLPDSITHIGMSAFYRSIIQSIDLPKNLKTIDEHAFAYCDIRQLTIPSLVSSIDNYAFSCNLNLTDIIFEERTIPLILRQGVFSICKKLTSITLPDSVNITSGVEAFLGCENLKTAKLPDNAETIPSGLFSGCTRLETVEVGKIKSIGEKAFEDCSNIINFDFTNCTDVGEYAFFGCTKLQSVQTNKINTIGRCAFLDCRSITSFDFTYCTSIGNNAFQGCKGFTSMNIPSNIVKIGVAAFSGCTGLTSVTLPDNITIGTGVFSGCTNLKTAKLPESMEVIPEYFFSGCRSLESTQTGKIKSIGMSAFSNCQSITDFDFTYCQSIGSHAFEKCTGFTSMILPDNVTIIGSNAFSECTNLKTVKLPDSIDTIPNGCFSDCKKLESIQTGEIKSIGYGAFSNCINLTDISFAKDNSISTVYQNAFKNCYKLTEIDLCNVKEIYYSAFENCTGLTKVNFAGNAKLVSIGEGAFNNCTSLERIDIPSSCKTICEKAFNNCYSLSEVTLCEGLEEIQQQAFFNCYSLYEILIPDSVSLIEVYAFACFEHEGEIYVYSDFAVLGSTDSLADEYAQAYGVQYANAIQTPKLSSISNTSDGIKITFEKLSGVSGYYRVYRKTADTSWSKLADVTTASYTDKTAVSGVYYTYTVKFIGYDGTESRYDKNGLSITRLLTPTVTDIANTNDGVKLTISEVKGAAYYRVYYKTSDGWKGIDNTDTTTFVHESAKSGESYTYTVKAFDKYDSSSSFDSKGFTNQYIATPEITAVSSTKDGVKISWNKVTGAVNYRVYIKTSTGWKGLGNTTSDTFTDTSATSRGRYTYTVRCMAQDGKTAVSGYDKEGKSCTVFSRAPEKEMIDSINKIQRPDRAEKSPSALKPQPIKKLSVKLDLKLLVANIKLQLQNVPKK